MIHTLGHAASHLCLLLLEDGLLFSGDHILNGSTTVIDPRRQHGRLPGFARPARRPVRRARREFILPAHGYALGQARRTIAQLRAHRLAREAKVLAAMQALPDGSLQQWVEHAYADVPPRLWPVAQRSLLAHVERIRGQEPGND